MLSLFDNIYGVLFLPQATFLSLRDRSVALEGAIVVLGVNIIEGLRTDSLLPQVLASLVGWFGAAVLLERLGGVFNKEINLSQVLGLTGFASLPWIFFAPALNLGGSLGAICALAVVVWFLVWQGWGIATVLEIPIPRALSLIPLAFAASIVTLLIFLNGATILWSISNLFHLP